MPLSELITPAETREILQISVAQYYRLLASGAYRDGEHRSFPEPKYRSVKKGRARFVRAEVVSFRRFLDGEPFDPEEDAA